MVPECIMLSVDSDIGIVVVIVITVDIIKVVADREIPIVAVNLHVVIINQEVT